jgi:hypothetical protein
VRMTDSEIRDLLQLIPAVSGWPRHQRAWVRTHVEQAGADLAAIDAWVVRVGGNIEEHHPQRTLAPYHGQQPIPPQTLYLLPRSVLDESRGRPRSVTRVNDRPFATARAMCKSRRWRMALGTERSWAPAECWLQIWVPSPAEAADRDPRALPPRRRTCTCADRPADRSSRSKSLPRLEIVGTFRTVVSLA